eukprot:gene40584-biopygen33032
MKCPCQFVSTAFPPLISNTASARLHFRAARTLSPHPGVDAGAQAGQSVGTVKNWNMDKGFGFIIPKDGGEEPFVNRSCFAQSREAMLIAGATVYPPLSYLQPYSPCCNSSRGARYYKTGGDTGRGLRVAPAGGRAGRRAKEIGHSFRPRHLSTTSAPAFGAQFSLSFLRAPSGAPTGGGDQGATKGRGLRVAQISGPGVIGDDQVVARAGVGCSGENRSDVLLLLVNRCQAKRNCSRHTETILAWKVCFARASPAARGPRRSCSARCTDRTPHPAPRMRGGAQLRGPISRGARVRPRWRWSRGALLCAAGVGAQTGYAPIPGAAISGGGVCTNVFYGGISGTGIEVCRAGCDNCVGCIAFVDNHGKSPPYCVLKHACNCSNNCHPDKGAQHGSDNRYTDKGAQHGSDNRYTDKGAQHGSDKSAGISRANKIANDSYPHEHTDKIANKGAQHGSVGSTHEQAFEDAVDCPDSSTDSHADQSAVEYGPHLCSDKCAHHSGTNDFGSRCSADTSTIHRLAHDDCSTVHVQAPEFIQECWCGDAYGKHGTATGCNCGANDIGADMNCVYSTTPLAGPTGAPLRRSGAPTARTPSPLVAGSQPTPPCVPAGGSACGGGGACACGWGNACFSKATQKFTAKQAFRMERDGGRVRRRRRVAVLVPLLPRVRRVRVREAPSVRPSVRAAVRRAAPRDRSSGPADRPAAERPPSVCGAAPPRNSPHRSDD